MEPPPLVTGPKQASGRYTSRSPRDAFRAQMPFMSYKRALLVSVAVNIAVLSLALFAKAPVVGGPAVPAVRFRAPAASSPSMPAAQESQQRRHQEERRRQRQLEPLTESVREEAEPDQAALPLMHHAVLHASDLLRRASEYGRAKVSNHYDVLATVHWVRVMLTRGLGLPLFTTPTSHGTLPSITSSTATTLTTALTPYHRPAMAWRHLAQLGPRTETRPPSVADTVVYGEGTERATVGEVATFYIRMMRSPTEPYPYPGDWFEISLHGYRDAGAARARDPAAFVALAVPRVQDLYNGTYCVTYTLSEPGVYLLSVAHTITQYQDLLTPRLKGFIPWYEYEPVGKARVSPAPASPGSPNNPGSTSSRRRLLRGRLRPSAAASSKAARAAIASIEAAAAPPAVEPFVVVASSPTGTTPVDPWVRQQRLPLCRATQHPDYNRGRWLPEPPAHRAYYNESLLLYYPPGKTYDYRRPPPKHQIMAALASLAADGDGMVHPIGTTPPLRPYSSAPGTLPSLVWAPRDCRSPWFSRQRWRQCVAATDIGSIVFFGDSIMGQYFGHLRCQTQWPKNMYVNDLRKCSWERHEEPTATLRQVAIGELVRFKQSDRREDWIRHFQLQKNLILGSDGNAKKRNIFVLNSGSHQCMAPTCDCSFSGYEEGLRTIVAWLRENWDGEVVWRSTLAAQRSLIRRERYVNILAIQYMHQRRAVELNRIARAVFEQASRGEFRDPPGWRNVTSTEPPTPTVRHNPVERPRTVFRYLDTYDMSLGRPEAMMFEDVRHPASEMLLNQVVALHNFICNENANFRAEQSEEEL